MWPAAVPVPAPEDLSQAQRRMRGREIRAPRRGFGSCAVAGGRPPGAWPVSRPPSATQRQSLLGSHAAWVIRKGEVSLSAMMSEMTWMGNTAVVMASVILVSVVPRQARAAKTSNKAHAAVTKLAAVLPA